MEDHRLKPMKENYNEKLFNELYKKTEQLRRKLAYEIDSRRFGVDYHEVLSWFDVKFIYTYNKYCDKEPERLLGYIINSLRTYKYRVLRMSYQNKYINTPIRMDEIHNLDGIKDEGGENENRELFINMVLSFIKKEISEDAYMILELHLNPPPFILNKIQDKELSINKIPSLILAEYLDLGVSKEVEG